MPKKMPVLFVGHGSPVHAIEDTAYARDFAALSHNIQTPRAILVISAHWFVPGTWLTGGSRPQTIHDFRGFAPALSEIRYPAPGAPELARQISAMISSDTRRAGVSMDWGLDHGTWCVLRRAYASADVPVLQLSIDRGVDATAHLEIGRTLRDLRHQGVLIVGSGNVVHNLGDAFARLRRGLTDTPEWARAFDNDVVNAVEHRDNPRLASLWHTEAGRRAHPSPDHLWPLLYAVGASDRDDAISYPITGFEAGSLSMRAIRFG